MAALVASWLKRCDGSSLISEGGSVGSSTPFELDAATLLILYLNSLGASSSASCPNVKVKWSWE